MYSSKLVVFVTAFVFIASAMCYPRDVAVQRTDDVQAQVIEDEVKLQQVTEVEQSTEPLHNDHVHGRIPCQYEDATEDTICQQHCLPKGYSYGICVSYRCSCV